MLVTAFSLTLISLAISFILPCVIVQAVWGGGIAETSDTSNMSLGNENSSNDTFTINTETIDLQPGYVSGRYFNPETGLEITIPEGWNGTQNKNKIGSTQLMISLPFEEVTSVNDSKPFIGLNIYPINATQDERFGVNNMDYYAAFESSETVPNDPALCKRTSFENIKIGGYPALAVEIRCPFPFDPSVAVKGSIVILQKDKSEILFLYSTPSPSNYEKYLPDFDKLISSVNFSAPRNGSSASTTTTDAEIQFKFSPSQSSSESTNMSEATSSLDVSNETIPKFSTYENITAGLKIAYPADWILEQEKIFTPMLQNTLAKFTPPNDSATNFTIGTWQPSYLADPTISGRLKLHANIVSNNYKTMLKDFNQTLFDTNGMISGNRAYEIDGTYLDDQSIKHRLFEVGTIVGMDKVYVAQFNTQESKTQSYLPILKVMIPSFEIIQGMSSQGSSQLNSAITESSGDASNMSSLNTQTIYSNDSLSWSSYRE